MSRWNAISPRALRRSSSYPQDVTRVFLNMFSNGFYAATRRARNAGDAGFTPTLKVTTRDAGEAVEIRVRDNGTGIPRRHQGQAVPAVLHHQANRRGHRPWPVDQLRHRHAAAWRQHRRRQQGRRIQRVHDPPAAQPVIACKRTTTAHPISTPLSVTFSKVAPRTFALVKSAPVR